jgi:hypothetical protein
LLGIEVPRHQGNLGVAEEALRLMLLILGLESVGLSEKRVPGG